MRTFLTLISALALLLTTPYGAGASRNALLAGFNKFDSKSFCQSLFWKQSEERALFAQKVYFLRVNRGTSRSVVLIWVFATNTKKVFLSADQAETIATEVQTNAKAFGFGVDNVYTIALPRGESEAEVGCKYYSFSS